MKDFEILKWDSDFFGYKIAKINSSVGPDRLNTVLFELHKNGVELVYFNSTFNLGLYEHYKNYEIDRSVSLSKVLKEKKVLNPNVKFFIEKEPTFKMLELSRRIARRSRFYVDPNIPNSKVYDLYEIWLNKSVSESGTNTTLIYEKDAEILGFATIRIENGNEGRIPLMGVAAENEGKGISFILMQAIETYLMEQNCKVLKSATQSKNLKALKVYQRFGISCEESFNINHLWLKSVL